MMLEFLGEADAAGARHARRAPTPSTGSTTEIGDQIASRV